MPANIMSMSDAPATTAQPDVEKAVQKALAEARERIESISLPRHWHDCIEYLDENFAFFLTHVLNMGNPEWNGSIPTAAVALPAKGETITDDFRFMFNPVFAALLDPD